MKRSLQLARETLGSLSDDDLSGVVGGYVYTREGGGLTCGGLAGCADTVLSCGCAEMTIRQCVDLTDLTCRCNSFPNC